MNGATYARRLTGALAGAIAMFEVRGPRAGDILRGLGLADLPELGACRRARLRTASGIDLDEALLLCIADDAFEIGVHGGPAVLDGLRRALEELGARFLEPWTAATAVARRVDRIAAHLVAPRALLALLAQRGGALVRELEGAIRVVRCGDPAAARASLERSIASSLECLPFFSPRSIALVGPPNAGKSTFMNAVVGAAENTVDARAGSTLDPVMRRIALGDHTVDLWDTAGLDPEARGVAARARAETERRARAADLVLWLSARGGAPVPPAWRERVDREVATHSDLGPSEREGMQQVSALRDPDGCRRALARIVEERWPSPAGLAAAEGRAFDAELLQSLRDAAAAPDATEMDRRLAALVNALRATEH